MGFLHGVETIRSLVGPTPIMVPRSAVIGLVGTAPIHHVTGSPATPNTLVQLASDTDYAKLGPSPGSALDPSKRLSGYSIPRALNAIKRQGGGLVLAINIFDPTLVGHQTSVAEATLAINSEKKIVLANQDIISVTVKTVGDVACASPTDYTIDRINGVITITPGGQLAAATNAKVAYIRGNPAAITGTNIIGATTGGGTRTGAQALLNARNLFGFTPKVLIAPGFTSAAAVRDALLELAASNKLRSIVLADVAAGATRDDVVQGRGPSGTLDLRSASQRVVYSYPQLRPTDTGDLEPFSSSLAGVISRVDAERGYWHSPSNKDLQGVSGLEVPVSWALTDADCDANIINGAGVVTVAAGYGTGLRTWGNRSGAFPASTDLLTFIPALRTSDMIDEAIEQATLKHVDGPVTRVLVDAVLEDVGAFLRQLVSRGALFPGAKVTAPAEKNPPVELAAGHITFVKTYCPPPPAERVTHETVIDVNQLKL